MRIICFTFSSLFCCVVCFPDPGRCSGSYINVPAGIFGTHKPLYAGSSIYISVNCESQLQHQEIEIQWVIRQTSCYEDYLASNIYTPDILKQYFMCPMSSNSIPRIRYYTSIPIKVECSNRIHLEFVNATFVTYSDKHIPSECESSFLTMPLISDPLILEYLKGNKTTTKHPDKDGRASSTISPINISTLNITGKDANLQNIGTSFSEQEINIKQNLPHFIINNDSLYDQLGHSYISRHSSAQSTKLGSKLATVDMDGIYFFILKIEGVDEKGPQNLFNISVDIAMKGEYGYLSAVDYPLLIFYGVMCALYVLFAIAWLMMSALQWRDLLRIQFWIGAVILLGLMEKAVFYAEYQSINYTGQSVQGAILFAEILSCMKRTLARMLIIIVSLGFGIVKPRLGSTLHRIIGIGALYFCLGTIEGCLRVLKPKTDPGNEALMAGIPLAVTDSIISWWVFSSLVQTIRTLRLRRNIVKLQLYRHFTNTLILSVIGSIVFDSWLVHAHRLVNCITDWKELWVDEAYWHFLFSIILFVIMILWRPTNNNQRYAFTPLLDAVDDEDEDDEENSIGNDAFAGMKMRSSKSNSSISPKSESHPKDDDLKWVEENIPTSLTDVALPTLLDSDEEIMTAKFERSKME